MENKHARLTKTSVTNFLHFGDEYLFVMRSPLATINPSQLNGIGGKLDPGEDYITAAIRETEEETGYKITVSDIEFCGIIRFESKDTEDWITCFYKIAIPNKEIPHSSDTREGKLMWIHKDEVINSGHELVDDLQYIFEDIASGKNIFFINAQVEGKEFRIVDVTIHKLPR